MKKSELKELYQMMFPEYPDIVTVRQLREMLGISRTQLRDILASLDREGFITRRHGVLDDGEPCVCPQTISYSLLCRYFRNAVLPAEKELYADIFKQRTYHCAECGAAFVPNSNRQKYCLSCSKKVHRRQKNESARKRKADN